MKRLFFIISLLLCLPLAAQVLTRRSDGSYRFEPLLDRLYKVSQIIPQEKVYIHMDNTCYFQGDTIWFAAYTRKTSTDTPSDVSGVLYVELLNNDGYLVERKMIEMKRGRGNGFFALNNQIQYSGFYELRAYTRWQLNWGQYVHKHCQDMEPYFYNKDLERAFYTDYEKLYSRVFPVYDEPLDSGDYTHRMTLRVLRRTFKNDPDAPQPTLALFPEGGNLVAGVENRVAFEAVMSDGQWLKGSLKASPLTLDSVASLPNANARLASLRGEGNQEEVQVGGFDRGRGVFTIVPERGMEREVTFTTEDGQTVKARLPKPEERGVALQVRQEGDSTHIVLHLAGVSPDSLGLTIMHEGKVSLLRTMTKGLGFSFHNSTMPCGVNQVTVFDTEGHVWADRLFFVRKREEMQPTLDISGMKDEYQPYEPITLDVQGRGTRGLVSLTVRDSHQSDALYDNANIMTEMLLSSEIRGFVPNPGWYFEADDSLRRVALDLLMMTQGWRRFNWRDMAVKGAWELTQPSEQTPIIIGKVRPNPRRNIINTLEAEQYYDWLEKRVDEINDEDESPEENSSEQDPKDISRESQGDIKAKAASKRRKKHNPLRIHVEYVPANTLEPKIHEMDTKDYNFRFQLPHTYGKGVLFISVADTTTWKKRKKPYTWIQMAGTAGELALHHQRKLDTEEAEYRAYVAWPYPRFVRPFDYHHVHLMEVKDDSALLQTPRSDSIHQMQQVTVKARRKNRLARFNDAFPALSMDAYEAWNMIDDAGMVNLYDSYAYFARVLVSDYGQASIYSTDAIGNAQRIYEQFGISPIRRSLPQYRDIPTDSLYHPKYLTSIARMDFSPGERRQYWGDERIDEDWRFLIDRYVLYTDYQPRLEGSKRYAGANLPETRVAIYPFYDGSKRVVYRDRRYVLDGFAAPAEFYSPDYSRYKLPEGQKDYRRTLYWNPNLKLDAEGRARVTLYNNSRTTQIQVEAAGQAADGTLLWNK